MAEGDNLLELQGVVKTFGSMRVLNHVSVSCAPGEIVLLLGANGAGKSTLLRVMAGLTRCDQGQVHRARTTSVGFISHHLLLYNRLSARENLALTATLGECGRDAVARALSTWALDDVADLPVSDLSKGTQARVGLARAFLNRPRLRFLDEPSSNLDDRGVELLRAAIKQAEEKPSATVVATHDVHRLQGLGTRVVVMSRGEIVGDSGPGAAQGEIDRVVHLYRESNR